MPTDLEALYGISSLFERLMGSGFAENANMYPDTGLSARHFPPIQLFEDEESLTLRALVPGIAGTALSLDVESSTTLILKGEFPSVKGRHYRKERPAGTFRRVISLPHPVAPDQVEASLRNGVLSVSLRKLEQGQKRTIPVSDGGSLS